MDHQQMSWRDWHGLWMEHFHNEAVRRGCSIDELIALFDVWCVLCMNEGYLSPDVEETARIAQAPVDVCRRLMPKFFVECDRCGHWFSPAMASVFAPAEPAEACC